MPTKLIILAELRFSDGLGEWTLWSQWSSCVNNQRMRARGCYHISSARCAGNNMEKQKCTGGIAIDVDGERQQVADPWKEEREQAAAQLGI